MQEEYDVKGLTVISASGESKEKVSAFVDKHEVKYPIFCEARANDYSGTGVPRAALISAEGKVVFVGHPNEIKDDMIEKELKKVSKSNRVSTWAFTIDRALPDVPEKMAPVVKELTKKKFGAALKRAEGIVGKLEGDDKANGDAVVEWIRTRASDNMDQAATLVSEGKIYAAHNLYEVIEDEFKGHALGKDAKAACKELMADKANKLEVKAGKKFEALKVEARKERTKEKKIDVLKAMLSKKYAETEAGKAAAKLIEDIQSGPKKK